MHSSDDLQRIETNSDPEGYEEDKIDLTSFPIDSLMIRNETRTVFEVCRRIEAKKFILNPDFQRDFLWLPLKQSKLIESCLLRIPLPVFYLAEASDGNVIVVDGLQRLTTFFRFLHDEFKLSGLDFSEELNGLKFSELPIPLQNRIEDTQLTLYLIDSRVPDQARYEIFERVNAGVPLTRQQMRNCILHGQGTTWLAEMAATDDFLSATQKGLNSLTMRDRECINRFAAFKLLDSISYSGKMDAFLDKALIKLNTLQELGILSSSFLRSMRNNRLVFGSHAFRRSISPNTKRSVINVALFDIFSVVLSEWDEGRCEEQKEEILEIAKNLLIDPLFIDSISRSTNSKSAVQLRFEMLNRSFDALMV